MDYHAELRKNEEALSMRTREDIQSTLFIEKCRAQNNMSNVSHFV